MARKMVVTATGKSYTATTTPATVQIPFNSADMWPSLLTISATAPVHIRLGDPSVTAATTDLMVQPADHVTIRTNGAGYISYRSASGTCNVQISPTEDGPMNYRGQIPDYIQGILAPYGSNAHVYLPGSTQTSYGPELWGAPTLFSDGTVTADGIDVVFTASSANISGGKSATGMTGKTFTVTYTLSGMDGGDQARVILYGSGFQRVGTTRTADGTYTEDLAVTTAGGSFTDQIRCQTVSGGTMRFSAISVREKITSSTVVSGLSSNNYTLSDGSTGYSAIDGTAGLVVDAAGSVGSDLAPSMASSTGWTLQQPTSGSVTVSGGLTTINSADGTLAFAQIGTLNATVGTTYSYSLTVSSNTGAGVAVQIGNVSSAAFTTPGTYSGYIVATNATPLLVKRAGGVTNTVVSAFSVREVTGIHATQSTTANKPAERRGLLNYATQSRTFSNAAWVKTDVTPVLDQTGPTGAANDAWTFTEGSAGTAFTYEDSSAAATTGSITSVIVVKRGNTDWFRVGAYGGGFTNYSTGWVNLATGATGSVTNNGTSTGGAISVADAGNGFYVVAMSATPGSGVPRIGFVAAAGNGSTTRVNGATSIIYAAGVLLGTLTAAQILAEGGIPTTTTVAASSGTAGRYWWQFDGTNDSLALGSAPFTMADDHCVIGAAASQLPTSDRYIFDVGNSGSVNAMCASLALNGTTAKVYWRDDSLANTTLTGGTVVQGSAGVLSARKSSGTGVLRVNGTQVATGAISLGTTTLTGAGIGVRVSPGNYFNGSIGPVILIKGTVSDADLLTLERWVAANTPAGPTF